MSLRGDVDQRWRSRVVPNGWHTMGKDGAREYVKKYGKGISIQKLEALAECARDHECEGVALGFEDAIKDILVLNELNKL